MYLEREGERRHRGIKVELTDKEIENFLHDAQQREKHGELFDQMEQLLEQLWLLYPLRVTRIRKDLKWLRRQAKKRQLSWGGK